MPDVAISNRRQRLVLTAVPHGMTEDGKSVLVGVHVSPRLSYDGPGGSATLKSFPDMASWPSVALSWSVTFDNGKTWFSPTAVRDLGDLALWRGVFPSSLQVRSFTGKQPTAQAWGYSYETLALGLLEAYSHPTIGDSVLGQAVPQARAKPQQIYRGDGTGSATDSMAAFLGFYAPDGPKSPRLGALEPDFHERLGLLGDHAPLMERLGTVVVLEVPKPLGSVPSVAVKATRRGRWQVPTTFHSPRTRVTLDVDRDLFVPLVTSDDQDWLNRELGLRLDTDQFSVHSLDVDSATAQLVGAAVAPGGQADSPPVGRSAGLTIAQARHSSRLTSRIAAGHEAATTLLAGKVPSLDAGALLMGYHAQIGIYDVDGSLVWRGIGNREVTYSLLGAGRPSFVAVDTAPITTAARRPDPDTPSTLFVSDVIARWDGWSIAVARPGRHLLQTGAVKQSLREGPQQAENTSLVMKAVVPAKDPEGNDGRLPLLRYGQEYLVRMRAVTVTGWAGSWDDAPASSPTTYYRWDPAPAPLVLAPEALTAGETARVLVVRSNPFASESDPTRSSRTLVPPRVSVEVGLLHGALDGAQGKPTADSWKRITDLDGATPPTYGPSYAATGGQDPVALPVTWMPDPLTRACHLDLAEAGGQDVSFLPPNASSDGLAEIGAWQSVAVQLVPATTADGWSISAPDERTGQRIVRVGVPPAGNTSLRVRANPSDFGIRSHGLAALQPGTDQQVAQDVRDGQVPMLTPSTEIKVIHAVRQPLHRPALANLRVIRGRGEKDVRIQGSLQYDNPSTGRLTVVASWSEWIDEADSRPPARLEVPFSPLYDEQVEPGPDSEIALSVDTRTPMADLRRRDLTVTVSATSCFVPHFREGFPTTFSTRSGSTRLYYDLPDDADVESLEVTRVGADPKAKPVPLVRGTDYQVDLAPGETRRTLSVPAGTDLTGIRVQGVHGSVLSPTHGEGGPTYTLIVPSAVRPAPPKVAYVVPSFAYTPPAGGRGTWTTSRSGMRVRIWLERPWWSSGDGEGLIVITDVVADADTPTTTALDRLVTTYANDPTVRPSGPAKQTSTIVSGTAAENLQIDEDLPEAERGSTLKGKVHDVVYDAERDMYAAEVTLPGVPAGCFVRLAVARYQPEMGPTFVGEDEIVRISRIVPIDPIAVLPQRTAQVATAANGRAVAVTLFGVSHAGPDDQHLPFVRVSLQTKDVEGADVGWSTVAHGEVDLDPTNQRSYPTVTVTIPDGTSPSRVLVEEYERWTVVDAQGAPTSAPAYSETLGSTSDARGDLTGVRPVYVATTPMP